MNTFRQPEVGHSQRSSWKHSAVTYNSDNIQVHDFRRYTALYKYIVKCGDKANSW